MKEVVEQSHVFNHLIDSEMRHVILLSNEGNKARRIPGFMKITDRTERKLFFQGKVFCCDRCHSKHNFREDCPSEQGDVEQQPPTEPNENREQQDFPDATPELHQDGDTPYEGNKVEKNDAAT